MFTQERKYGLVKQELCFLIEFSPKSYFVKNLITMRNVKAQIKQILCIIASISGLLEDSEIVYQTCSLLEENLLQYEVFKTLTSNISTNFVSLLKVLDGRLMLFLGARAPLGIGHVCMYVCHQDASDSPR